jgi:hypothetical protein
MAGEEDRITLVLASRTEAVMSPRPVELTSPVAFADPLEPAPEIDADWEDDWADDEEEGEVA